MRGRRRTGRRRESTSKPLGDFVRTSDVRLSASLQANPEATLKALRTGW